MAFLLLAPGCAWPQAGMSSSPNRPYNVFTWSHTLPVQVRRVALMPMDYDLAAPDARSGKEALEPIVQAELVKARRFEVVPVSAEGLLAKTGKHAWGCEEALPQDLFTWLSDNYNCDAVLFCTLTVFRGYAPLAIGWRMRLVDLRSRNTLWASDEVFDAEVPSVQKGARRFQSTGRRLFSPPADCWIMENSPRRFGQYAAAQLLATLPSL